MGRRRKRRAKAASAPPAEEEASDDGAAGALEGSNSADFGMDPRADEEGEREDSFNSKGLESEADELVGLLDDDGDDGDGDGHDYDEDGEDSETSDGVTIGPEPMQVKRQLHPSASNPTLMLRTSTLT